MKKMIIISETSNYKPCLDGKDIQSESEVINQLTNASIAGDRDTVVELAKRLINLADRNDKARTNEDYIQKISQYIVSNTDAGDALCENETASGVYADKVIRIRPDDTSVEMLTRAALLRLTEAKYLKKTYARVIEQGEKPYEAKKRVVYIAL